MVLIIVVFVADLRAATPSAAAEIVLPLKGELIAKISNLRYQSSQIFMSRLTLLWQQLGDLVHSQALKNPLAIFEIQFQKLDELKKNLEVYLRIILRSNREDLSALLGKLEALGPLATLRRGFSVSLKLPEEKVVASSKLLKRGDLVKTRLREGFFVSEVKETSN